MKQLALQVEHKFKNRVVGSHLIDGRSTTTTIGSSRTADIRLLGDEIAGLHAAIQLDGEEWSVSDLGSGSGTWVNKKPIIDCKIDGAMVIHIGHHQLKATPHMVERELFRENLEEGTGALLYHQVVVLKKGLVHDSYLLEKTAAYVSEIPGVGMLNPPTGYAWTITEKGPYTIKQRLTRSDEVKDTGTTIQDWKRPAPLIGAMLMLFLVVGMMFMLPQKPDDKMKTLTPEMENQYTRLIFDGKKVRAKKAIAEKLRKTFSGQSEQGVAKNTPGGDAGSKLAGNKAPMGAKVVMNIRNAGLSALIGKVAARASRNAFLIQSAGVAADNPHSGRAFGTGGGTSLDKAGIGGGGSGKSFKIGGLGTAGKGGGVTGYKGSGALALGKTGTADVGMIEEESEVDGGLDKEVIARVIRSQLGQIRYCYERQLSANPDLYGKIMVKFTIGAAGSVTAQSIGTTSLNNAMVEGCILRRVAGWQFPQPKGGTNVLVTYPFLFKSTR